MSVCARCEKSFTCGLLEGDPDVHCWCTTLPALPIDKLDNSDKPGSGSATCYCPDCLRELTGAGLIQDMQDAKEAD